LALRLQKKTDAGYTNNAKEGPMKKLGIRSIVCTFLLFGIIFLFQCTPLQKKSNGNEPTFLDVLYSTNRYKGETVTWGGQISNVTNSENGAELTLVQLPLTDSIIPLDARFSEGRFLAQTDIELNKDTYYNRRPITITGTVIGSEARPLGFDEYVYPVIEVKELHYWNEDIGGNYVHCWQSMSWDDPTKPRCE
jgi:outer membrane lipoprotein